jgi:hypothetical protein
MAESVLFVELNIDATNDAITEQMRIMKRARDDGIYENVVCCIRGFNDDPRELYENPEVQAFCCRMVSAGFISYLDFTTIFDPNAPQMTRAFWGASEVWLCSEGRLKVLNQLDETVLNELTNAVAQSNTVADAALGRMLLDELDFDFAALDRPDFKEDAVREDIVAPILRKAGYRATGSLRMERSKPLVHPFVMIGSKKHKINIVPDYTLYDDCVPLMVLEAKAPGEPIVRSVHVEQTYSYAIHQDVRSQHYALCNGHQLAFYHVSELAPLLLIDCKDVCANWEKVEKYLLPRYLKMPELRKFHADFGQQAKQFGITTDEEIAFEGFLLQMLTRSAESLYIANSTCNIGGLECMVSFDFGKDVLDAILAALPSRQSEQIHTALSRMPYSIDVDAKIRIHWKARLGEPIQGSNEEFIPMIVTELFQVDYDPSLTVGPPDPRAVQAGVSRLQV